MIHPFCHRIGLVLINPEERSWSREHTAVWKGSIKEGGGTISTETGVLREAPYGFKARFEGGKGTNPEELIGAAHAGCFSMAFSMILGDAGLKADSIDTHAEVTLDQVDGGFAITAVKLTSRRKSPGRVRRSSRS